MATRAKEEECQEDKVAKIRKKERIPKKIKREPKITPSRTAKA